MSRNLSGAAVLFDLDGTLVDTAEDLAASMNHALAGDGHAPVPLADVRHLVGHGARRMLIRGYQIAAGHEATDAELDDALSRFLDHYRANIAVHSRPYEGAVALIKDLRGRGAKMAVCTNKREAMAVQLLETLKIAVLFETIVGADSAEAPKPDPAPARLCLKRAGAERGVFIGDSDTDIKTAKAVKMPCLLAEFGYGPMTLAGEAAARFGSYKEAAALIDNLI
jgi:phosphoglycolate phosphatase